MDSNNRNRSRAAWARGFIALFAMLAMGLGLLASPVTAAPFVYVANGGSFPTFFGTVSVFDTATNPPSEVTTVPVGAFPFGVAVTPDGKHAYVTDEGLSTVSVIDTASNTVVATVGVGPFPTGVAVTPDGKHAYVTNGKIPGNVSVIDTATNTVVATVGVGPFPTGVAVTPDGKHVYVANQNSNTVSVIDTASNTVAATIPVGSAPFGVVAVTPDGKHVYVTNSGSNNVSVIATASNTVVATVPVGNGPEGVAVTPDGKHAYVTNLGSNNVSVIATASNTVVATVAVRNSSPFGVAIVPPPPGVPFLTFNAKLQIQFGSVPNHDAFGLGSIFTLSSTDSNGINPPVEAVTLQVGTFTATIPPGSFKKNGQGFFVFAGVIDGVSLQVVIKPTGTLRYTFLARATGPDLTGTKNAVYATLTIGGDSGATSVTAAISP